MLRNYGDVNLEKLLTFLEKFHQIFGIGPFNKRNKPYSQIRPGGHPSNRSIWPKICLTEQFFFGGGQDIFLAKIRLTGQFDFQTFPPGQIWL